jgi:hypothetical protein
VLTAAGQSLIFDGNGHSVVDWGLALKNIRSQNMTLVKLPGHSVFEGKAYKGEALADTANDFFASVTDGSIATFMVNHPEFINKAS